ncbi:MAG: hypothetical protein AABY22_19410, partial [Nanoarchaeota archaeon]
FPVAETLVIKAPLDEISKVMYQLGIRNGSELLEHQGNLKQKIREINPPVELNLYHKKIDINKAWGDLLSDWIDDLVLSSHHKHTLHDGKVSLDPKLLVLAKNVDGLGLAFINDDGDLEVEIEGEGKATPELLELLEALIKKANQKLVIPQIYYFLVEENQIKFVKLIPFTPSLKKIEFVPSLDFESKPIKLRRALKVFQELLSEQEIMENADGLITEIHNLSHAARILEPKPVLYRYNGDTLELKVFNSLKKKTEYKNLNLLVSDLLKNEDFEKYFLEINLPVTLINLDNLEFEKILGVIINLDNIEENLGSMEVENIFKFLENPLKVLHAKSLKVLLAGNLARNEEVLSWVIKKVIYGV